jgi:thioesterase domain-containing protein
MHDFRDTLTLERHIRASIPVARAMDLRVDEYDGYRLVLAAPLAPNINDKGCAFGGSMVSLLTLAGWGLINLKLAEAGLSAEVYIQDATVQYLAPVWDEVVAEAFAPDDPWTLFLDHLRDKGKARITIDAEIAGADGGLVAARQSARFVAKRTGGD